MDYFEQVEKLSRDLQKSSTSLDKQEMRYIVDLYYTVQKSRIRAGQKMDKLIEFKKPHLLIESFWGNFTCIEEQIKATLEVYTNSTHMGQWARSIPGVGPILAAALEAYIDIEKAKTAGSIWRFAGLDPTSKWKKGQKRPWNANLKITCWKIGQSFVKVSNQENDIYGKMYKYRKALELEKNARGEYAEQAEYIVRTYKKDTEAYKAALDGKLSLGHINNRAQRWATKMFLAHWHYEAYTEHYCEKPPTCYAVEHLGHAHEINNPEEARQWLKSHKPHLLLETKKRKPKNKKKPLAA